MSTILKKELRMYFEESNPLATSPFVVKVPDPRSDLDPTEIKQAMLTIIANSDVLYGTPYKALKAEIILTQKESYIEQVQS